MRLGWKLLMFQQLANRLIRYAIASLFVFSILLPSLAGAFVLSPNDQERFDGLLERTIQLQSDTLAAHQGTLGGPAFVRDAQCYFDLVVNLTEVRLELSHLQSVVSLSVLMIDPRDDRTVLSELKQDMVSFLKSVERDRAIVNRVPGHCPMSSFIAAKAQEMLNLYTAATSLVREVSSRI
jgi:hypothetical protein